MDHAQERGGSCSPLKLATPVHVGPFHLCLGVKFTVEHALSSPKGGFLSIRHNEIQDLTANILTEVSNYVCIETKFLPINGDVLTGASSNTQNGARLN